MNGHFRVQNGLRPYPLAVPPKVYPEKPQFRNDAEERVFNALYASLSGHDVIFCNLEMVDSQHGDIEIDFIVLIKNHGIAVVEVKGGNIFFDGETWMQRDQTGEREINPAGQARKNMYSLRNFLRNNWSQGQIRTEWVVAFPNYKYVDVGALDLPENRIIESRDLKNPLAKINDLLDAQTMYPKPSGDAWIKSAMLLLKPISDLDADFFSVLQNNHQYIKDLTHKQSILLDQVQDNDRYYVRGPAGSGKTWMAFEQAKRWTNQGLRVAILAFNRGVVTYMKMRNSELPEAERVSHISTFHGFAKYIGSTAGSPGNYNEENDKYGPHLIKSATELSEELRFDAFVVDEAQDFMESWWKTLELSLSSTETGKIAAFGDDQQKVFGKRKGPVGFHAKIKLQENIRNSMQIAELASSLVEASIAVRGPNSYPVELIECEEKDAMEIADDYVEQLTDEEGWKPGEIALLTTKNRHPVHAEMADKDNDAYFQSLWDSEDVFYGTVGGFKGLERPVVILAIDGFHHAEDLNDFLYVGMTRARDKLVVIGSAEMLDHITKEKE